MTGRLFRLAALIAGLALASALPAEAADPAPPLAASPFADWAAVVVAGDYHAHSGRPSEVFDNARRDVALALERVGFQPGHLRQFSVRPQRYADSRPGRSDVESIYRGLSEVAGRAGGGCLLYFSSHGAPEGVVVGRQLLSPDLLDLMIDQACGERPTVVVLSACFSGVFVPALAAPNRMVLTAARKDRTSFGCGEAERYPYFDDCFLSSMRSAQDFATLGEAVRACVAAREKKEGAEPPSEPQLWIGAGLKPMIRLMSFAPDPARN